MKNKNLNCHLTSFKHIFSLSIVTILLFAFAYKTVANAETYKGNNSGYIYLSDETKITYDKENSYVGWDQIRLNEVNGGAAISLYVDGTKTTFENGIFAHADSEVYFDISNYLNEYTYFTCYYGVNTTANEVKDGVSFYIYTSNTTDGDDWVLRDSNSSPLCSTTNAKYAEISLENVRRIRLKTYHNTSLSSDNAVWADAKLITYDDTIKNLDFYDEKIKNYYALYGADYSNHDDYKLYVLQREFVKNLGYSTLQSFVMDSTSKKEFISYLMANNNDMLEDLINGGKPSGSYSNCLNTLYDLYTTYTADLSDDDNHVLYTKMMVSLSLTHSKQVRFWIKDYVNGSYTTSTSSSNESHAIDRYYIFKDLYQRGKLVSYFNDLEVEEMRLVMQNEISDEEIEWIIDYTTAKGSTNPYNYLKYTTVISYWNEKYYSAENKTAWDDKYALTSHEVAYEQYYPKLWIIFEEGGVCWQISNAGVNINSAYGRPATCVGQPGHVAYLLFNYQSDGKAYWNIWNDVYGWTKTNNVDYNNINTYHPTRLLMDWGNASWNSNYEASYMILAQDCLNSFDNYSLAEETLLLLDNVDTFAEKETIIKKALSIQDINLDAWYELINLYVNESSVTEDILLATARTLVEKLEYYPLPMHDLLNLINNKISSSSYKASMNMLEVSALKSMSKLSNSDKHVLQPGVTRTMANYLLGNINTDVATFSFDGDDANKIVLGSSYAESNVTWEYSLDGGSTWKQVSNVLFVQLTSAEVESITAGNDVKVHIVGTALTEENIYTIDITKKDAPAKASGNNEHGLYGNDEENMIINTTDYMEWSIDGGTSWTLFKDAKPDLSGDKNIKVRYFASGTCLKSDAIDFAFTSAVEADASPEHTYIPIKNLQIAKYSSDQPSQKQNVYYCIDGNNYSKWHSNWTWYSDSERYVVIKLDKERYISGLRYIPNQGSGDNGLIYDYKISTSKDGTNWNVVKTGTWDYTGNSKATQSVTFEGGFAEYVKLEGTRTCNDFIAAGEISLYENTNAYILPTGTVTYSTTDPTEDDVIATLETDATIINNGGEDEYKFDYNGTFEFELANAYGLTNKVEAKVTWISTPRAQISYSTNKLTNKSVIATITYSSDANASVTRGGEALTSDTWEFTDNGEHEFDYDITTSEETISHKIIAEVNWIDKSAPVGTIHYNIIDETNQDVVATLVCDEEVEYINTDNNQYTFTENGTFTFAFKDLAGNDGYATATVDWINKRWPNATISYSHTTKSKNPVVATISSNEDIVILNNDGNSTYTFVENGTFVFEYMNKAGTKASVEAVVDWIGENGSYGNNGSADDTFEDITPVTNIETKTLTKESLSTFKKDNIEVTFNSSKDISLIKEEIEISDDLQAKFDNKLSLFKLYFVDEENKIVDIADAVKITLKAENNKNILGVYKYENDDLIEIEYKTSTNGDIVLEDKLTTYLINYEEKEVEGLETVQKDIAVETEETGLSILPIVALAIVLVLLISVILFIKKRNKE